MKYMGEIEPTRIPETPNDSNKTEVAEKALKELVKAVVPEKSKNKASVKQKSIEAEKQKARKITEGLSGDKYTETEQRLQMEAAYPKEGIKTIAEAKAKMKAALGTRNGANVSSWLGETTNIEHNPDAAAFVAHIAESPMRLQDDPHFLMAEGAKLFWSTRWAELSPEAERETRMVMQKITERVEVLRSKVEDFKIPKNTVRESLLPEARMGMARRTSTTTGYISGETAYTDLLNGLDTNISDLPTEFKDRIARLQDLISGPNAGIREGDMDLAIRDLDNLRGRSKAAFTADNDWTIAEIKRRFMERKAIIQSAIEKREYIPNRLYLDPELAERGMNDPIGTADFLTNDALVQIFRGNENSPLAKVAMERLEQLQYLLFSPTFDERRLGMLTPEDIKKIVEFRAKFKESSRPQQEEFARSFNIRFKAATWLGVYKDAPSLNDKRYQEYVNSRMDEDDFFGLDGLYGALVGRFRRALSKNYTKHIFDEHGQRRGMDPKWWDKAVNETIEEMRINKRNKDRFKKYRDGEFFKMRPGSTSKTEVATLRPVKPLTEEELNKEYGEACTVITDLAKVRMLMNFEKANLDARYAPPKWSQSQQDIASDFLAKQRELRLSHPYENHLMQWNTFGTGKTELERVNIRHRAEIWLETMPEAREYGNNHADEIWERIEQWKSGNWTKEQKQILFGQIDALFYFQPDPLRRPPNPAHNDIEMGSWIKNVSKDRLQKEAQIYAGMQLSQRFDLNPYFMMFESGYRRDVEKDFLTNAVGVMKEVMGDDALFGVFDAGTVVGATISYNNALTSGNSEGAKEFFLKDLAPVAQSRPHELVLALKEGHSSTLPGVEASLVENHEGGFLGAYDELASNFNEIHDELLEKKFHAQINYFKGLNGLDEEVQKEVVNQWFQDKYGDQAKQKKQWYFKSMEKMSHYLLGEELEPKKEAETGSHKNKKGDQLRYILLGNIGKKEHTLPYKALNEFANPGFIPLLSKGRWDDFPYEWLQEPERILGMMDPERTNKNLKDGAIRRISDLFIGAHAGDEQSGPYRRMHRDAGGAQDALELEAGTMVPDEKIHIEATQKKYLKIAGYQGADAAALSTDVGSGARIRTQLVLPTHGPFFEKMQGACEMSKYGFPHVKAISADEAHTSLLADREATFGVGMNVPTDEKILEAVEAHAGISNWDRVFRAVDYIPVLGQAKRAVEVKVGHKRWARLKEQLNNRFATGIIAHKGIMSLPYIGFVLGVYIISELSRGSEGDKKSH